MRAAGLRWRDYDRFMQKHVKSIGDERLSKIPADLDLKPYRDEHDFDLLRRMQDAAVRTLRFARAHGASQNPLR